ncbi:unnamed protein product [Owenia fusiformis]|uniref:Uncharacterized protein n=1 Tax=Owenia fusiformis TaxID=6347 RepID=A0A8J1U955_OWEFU|nr:unnamed protein product [Owenia fusiformis]
MCWEFYHYTTLEGLEAIRRSKRIKKTEVMDARDALLGRGVYFTTLRYHRFSKDTIIYNNWAVRTGCYEKIKCVVKVMIERYQKELKPSNCDRDIWIFQHDDVDLNKFKHEFITLDDSDFGSRTDIPNHNKTSNSSTSSDSGCVIL